MATTILSQSVIIQGTRPGLPFTVTQAAIGRVSGLIKTGPKWAPKTGRDNRCILCSASSTSRLARRSASKFHQLCSPAPTRLSNESALVHCDAPANLGPSAGMESRSRGRPKPRKKCKRMHANRRRLAQWENRSPGRPHEEVPSRCVRALFGVSLSCGGRGQFPSGAHD